MRQGCILFHENVFENLAMGHGEDDGMVAATREEVVEACRVALMREFVRDLPEGYETR